MTPSPEQGSSLTTNQWIDLAYRIMTKTQNRTMRRWAWMRLSKAVRTRNALRSAEEIFELERARGLRP